MKFSANDLYLSNGDNPVVSLHDCEFTIKEEGEDLVFDFPEGFIFGKEGDWNLCVHGTIRAVKVDKESLQIRAIRCKERRGRYYQKVEHLSLEELLTAVGTYRLENYHEFYSYREFLWTCSPWDVPKYRKKLGDEVELQVFYDHLEYDISDEYIPYEG